MLGGTQSLHTNSYDEAIALPTEKAARLALRTQQVIAYETDLTATVDPFAGSYAVEAMTDELEAAIRELMATVEEMGGAVAAIEQGFQKREIEKSAYDVVALGSRTAQRTVVGVNRFARERPEEPLRAAAGRPGDRGPAARAAGARCARERDDAAVDRHLEALREAAAGTDNVLYPMHDALRARATVGEVCNALRDVWGVYVPDRRLLSRGGRVAQVSPADLGPPRRRCRAAGRRGSGQGPRTTSWSALRRDLHAHPELSWAEVRTTAAGPRAADRRRAAARDVLPGGTGLVCDIGDGRPDRSACGPTSTPCRSWTRKDVPYRSTVPGVCHACGHDVHTAAVLGAGLVLAELARRGSAARRGSG